MKTIRRNTIEEVCAEVINLETPAISEVDNGIGAYEYWGSKGVDVQLDGEVEELDDIRIELHFQLQKLNINLLSENFSEFIESILIDVDEAVAEVEEKAKRKAALDADEYGKTDYSDIIKLFYTTSIETKPNSVEIHRVIFVFTWGDGRDS